MFDLFVRTYSDWQVARDADVAAERQAERPVARDSIVRRRDPRPAGGDAARKGR